MSDVQNWCRDVNKGDIVMLGRRCEVQDSIKEKHVLCLKPTCLRARLGTKLPRLVPDLNYRRGKNCLRNPFRRDNSVRSLPKANIKGTPIMTIPQLHLKRWTCLRLEPEMGRYSTTWWKTVTHCIVFYHFLYLPLKGGCFLSAEHQIHDTK